MQLQFLGNDYQASNTEIETIESPLQGTYRGATTTFSMARTMPATHVRNLKFRGVAY